LDISDNQSIWTKGKNMQMHRNPMPQIITFIMIIIYVYVCFFNNKLCDVKIQVRFRYLITKIKVSVPVSVVEVVSIIFRLSKVAESVSVIYI